MPATRRAIRGRAGLGREDDPVRATRGGAFKIAHWTAHDLRRSALTHMARLGVAPIVLAHVANHVSATHAGVTMSV